MRTRKRIQCKNGWVEYGEKRYFMRSRWEMNYAAYLEWIKIKGEIQEWEYEPETFWFDRIKRGVRSYTPDFRLLNKDGSVEYHEVKGWMDPKSATKIKRMRIYHPDIKLIVIDKNAYNSIKKHSHMIPRWED